MIIYWSVSFGRVESNVTRLLVLWHWDEFCWLTRQSRLHFRLGMRSYYDWRWNWGSENEMVCLDWDASCISTPFMHIYPRLLLVGIWMNGAKQIKGDLGSASHLMQDGSRHSVVTWLSLSLIWPIGTLYYFPSFQISKFWFLIDLWSYGFICLPH